MCVLVWRRCPSARKLTLEATTTSDFVLWPPREPLEKQWNAGGLESPETIQMSYSDHCPRKPWKPYFKFPPHWLCCCRPSQYLSLCETCAPELRGGKLCFPFLTWRLHIRIGMGSLFTLWTKGLDPSALRISPPVGNCGTLPCELSLSGKIWISSFLTSHTSMQVCNGPGGSCSRTRLRDVLVLPTVKRKFWTFSWPVQKETNRSF